MYKSPIELLRHIYDECLFIEGSIKPEMKKDDLIDDEVLKRAITRSLEIIGEASKSIPGDIKLNWSEVPWKNIAGMRDKLIHDYIGVNYTIVWDVVKNKIPEIKEIISKIIEQESKIGQ
ncbi:MAG: DUF86 domain-containing protein [Bacteroidota bacterium]